MTHTGTHSLRLLPNYFNVDVPSGSDLAVSRTLPDGQFYMGGPDEISVPSADVSLARSQFQYEFPPHSVTALVIQGGSGPPLPAGFDTDFSISPASSSSTSAAVTAGQSATYILGPAATQ